MNFRNRPTDQTKADKTIQNPMIVDEHRPSRADAEAAVRTLIRWAGDNPDREGLLEMGD